MNKIIAALFLTVILIALPAGATPAHGQDAISVLIDGLKVEMEVEPIIQNDRTLVPFRAIAEAMNIAVSWDNTTRTVNAANGKTTVRLQIDHRTAYRNNVAVNLDTAPQIMDGRTLIPLRFFSEAFDCHVAWNPENKQVSIVSAPKAMTVIGFYALGDNQTSSWTNLFGQPYPAAAPGNTDVVTELALGWYSIDKQGNLLDKSRTGWQRPEGWENVLNTARQYHLQNEMVIHVTDGDGTITSLLNDEAAMAAAVKSISKEAKRYQGVNLDFEGLGYGDQGEQLKQVQERFTRFVTLLEQSLAANGIRLTLTLHAPNSAYPGYDYSALGKVADRIIIMAYDYGSKPEPVNMVKQAVEAACASVPTHKLILGISAPSETADSLKTKIGIAKRYNLNGIALWRLGLVSDDMWEALRNSVIVED